MLNTLSYVILMTLTNHTAENESAFFKLWTYNIASNLVLKVPKTEIIAYAGLPALKNIFLRRAATRSSPCDASIQLAAI